MSAAAKPAEGSVAEHLARLLAAQGVRRIYGLQGGHIQPIWDWAARLGIRVVDARDERAAAHMAHADAELTGGLGVALATAGPGVTNAVTAIANADLARTPLVLIGGAPPRAQAGAGALQELPQIEIMRPITRLALSLREPARAAADLDRAIAAARGEGGAPGPVFVEIPTDVLRAAVPPALVLDEYLKPKPPPRAAPDPGLVGRAADLLWRAEKPLVISGRGARGAQAELVGLLDATGALYLDTQESRGLVPDDHPSVVAAMRGKAMAEADVVVLVGRKLDYQLGYGSPALFARARFLRLADNAAELRDGRRGAVELLATPALALAAMVEFAGNRKPAANEAWGAAIRAGHVARAGKLRQRMAEAAPGGDGFMHPYRLLAAIGDALEPDSIVIADGGDILSFARIALSARSYLDAGALGCLGVGVPFAVGAALACPERKVIAITGDGAFGFNAMEIDSAVRHGARAVFVVANNAAWNIERYDQITNYDGRIEGSELRYADYAAMARALGLHGERIEDPGELPGALARAFARAPALIDVLVTRDAVSPDARSGLAVVPDLQPLTSWDAAEKARRGR